MTMPPQQQPQRPGPPKRPTMTNYTFLPRMQGREKEKMWLWVWTAVVLGSLLAVSLAFDVNLLKSEEIAAVLIKQQGGPPPTPVVAPPSAPTGGPSLAGGAKEDDEKAAEARRARSLAVEAARGELEKATSAFVDARNKRDAAKNKYEKLRDDDTAKPDARLAAKGDMAKTEADFKAKEEVYLRFKAQLEALTDQARVEKERAALTAKMKEMEKAKEEWENARSGEGGDSRSTLSLIIEYTLMLGLWLVFGISVAGFYLVWNVRRRNFYRGETHRAQVVRALVAVMRSGQDANMRWEAFRREKTMGVLSDRPDKRNHLDEVVDHLSRAGTISDAHIDRYFTAQSRDIREEEYHRLSIINLCGALGPVFGFSGTVLGMIMAFSQLGSSKMSQDMIGNIALAINVALVTTLLGLLIKGIALIVRTWVFNSIDEHALAISLLPSEAQALVSGGGSGEYPTVGG